MSDSPNPIDRATPITPATPLDRRRPARPQADDAAAHPVEDAASFDGIPATIPDEVLAEVDGAAERLEELQADGTTVRFDADAGGGARIHLVGADGTSREIRASELFDVVAGDRPPAPEPRPEGSPRIDREA